MNNHYFHITLLLLLDFHFIKDYLCFHHHTYKHNSQEILLLNRHSSRTSVRTEYLMCCLHTKKLKICLTAYKAVMTTTICITKSSTNQNSLAILLVHTYNTRLTNIS